MTGEKMSATAGMARQGQGPGVIRACATTAWARVATVWGKELSTGASVRASMGERATAPACGGAVTGRARMVPVMAASAAVEPAAGLVGTAGNSNR